MLDVRVTRERRKLCREKLTTNNNKNKTCFSLRPTFTSKLYLLGEIFFLFDPQKLLEQSSKHFQL